MSLTREQSIEVLDRKFQNQLSRAGTDGEAVLKRIVETGAMMNDFVATLGNKGHINFTGNGVVHANVEDKGYRLHLNAISQIADKLGVPGAYAKELADKDAPHWQHELIAHTFNQHAVHTDKQRVLVRSVGDEVRGVLSDQYRRLDTPNLANAFVESALKSGARFISAHADDLQTFIEVVLPDLIEIPTENNGIEVMAYGIRFASGDFGTRAVELRSFLYKPVCTNGMVRESVMRQVHLGGRIPDNIRLSEETFRSDTHTQALAIRDVVGNLLSADSIKTEFAAIQDASAQQINVESEIKMLPKIGVLKHEAENVGKVLASGRAADGVVGEPTLWKLVNGLTAVARDSNATRRRELEEIAGSLMRRVSGK